jgi:hypothetical protein
MLLALSFALSAPVGADAIALIVGTTAVMTVHPQQALAELLHRNRGAARSAQSAGVSVNRTNKSDR